MSRPSRALVACGLAPTLLIALLSLYRPEAVSPLEHAAYDAVLRAAPTPSPGGDVVIVDVDEHSLSTIGQWPWRRDVVAALVSRLRDHGAAIVALDIIFAEADRYEGTAVSPDQELAHALRGGRVILGYGMTFASEHRMADGAVPREPRRAGCAQHHLSLVVIDGGREYTEPPYFQGAGAICSLPMLTSAAGASGFLNAAPDPDGLLRRAPLLIELDGRVYPSLGLAAVAAMRDVRDVTLYVANVNASSLVLSPGDGDVAAPSHGAGTERRVVPLDGKSNLLLRYRGPKRTFTYVSAADVLGGRVTPGAFAGKLVLVGTTALGTREVVSTPLDTLFTGVEVQATIADNLLQGDFIRRPASGAAIETLVLLLLGLATTALVARAGSAWGALGAGAGVAGVWAAALWLVATDGAFLSPLFPALGAIASLVSMSLAGFTFERRRAERAGEAQATSQRLMVQTLLSLTEIKDAETGQHSRRTQQYTRILAEELSRHRDFRDYLTPERVDLLATLAPLHDIGKVGVPDSVLNKPGALTPEEMVEMRRHPVHGRDVIVNAEREAGVRDDVTLAIAKDIAYTHHEKWDGTGYPEGLRGTDIPVPGRIVALVDVFDACTTRRLYMAPLSQDEAVALIVKGRGTHFDPAVVDAFLRVAPRLRALSEAANREAA